MPRLLELFAGTHSISKVFSEAGWECVSLDNDPDSGADIEEDFMTWDYTTYPRDFFQCVWASPPCTMYSIARTTAKTPRDFAGSDQLVQRVLDCIAYFQPTAFFCENPQTGYLKTRPVVQGLPYRDVSYCMFGYPYKKATRIWTNAVDWNPPAMCTRANPCEGSRATGRHSMTAQRAPGKDHGVRRPSVQDTCSLDMLHSMPPELCRAICQEANRMVAAAC